MSGAILGADGKPAEPAAVQGWRPLTAIEFESMRVAADTKEDWPAMARGMIQRLLLEAVNLMGNLQLAEALMHGQTITQQDGTVIEPDPAAIMECWSGMLVAILRQQPALKNLLTWQLTIDGVRWDIMVQRVEGSSPAEIIEQLTKWKAEFLADLAGRMVVPTDTEGGQRGPQTAQEVIDFVDDLQGEWDDAEKEKATLKKRIEQLESQVEDLLADYRKG